MSTKHDHIADTLTDEVLSGRYQPGDRLPSERELAARFDVNRGAVREAMKKLAQLGIVDIQPGGARVAPMQQIHHFLSAFLGLGVPECTIEALELAPVDDPHRRRQWSFH